MLNKIKKIKLRGALYRKMHMEEKAEKPKTRAGQVLFNMRKGGQPKFAVAPAKKLVMLPTLSEIKTGRVIYPLIQPYAYASIRYDEKENVPVYDIIEPKLNDIEKFILNKLQEGLIQVIDVALSDIKDKNKMLGFLEKNIDRLINEYDLRLSEKEYIKIMYYIFRDFVGLNRIEPILNDPYIEDIGLDGIGIPVYVVHQKFGSLKTNIVYTDAKELREFVTKLAERCDRYISYADPLLDGSLPDGTRVQASLASDVTTRGPTFSIRKFREEPLSPVDMMRLNTASAEMLAYIWFLIENGINILIAGGVSTGKTSLLNSISFFIPPEAKVVSIEDTRELNLPHENWIPGVSRTGFTGTGVGEVTMYELLRESFRQNPDYLIVGEIRGKEAYVMFQGMASVPGDQKILVVNDNNLKRIPIGSLNVKSTFRVPTFDFNSNTVKLSPFSKVEHSPTNELYKITTATGRSVVTTAHHSLFTYQNGRVETIPSHKMRKNDNIMIPGLLPSKFNDIEKLDLIEILPEIRVFAPHYIKKAVEKMGYEKACEAAGVSAISDYYANFTGKKQSALHARKFIRLMESAGIKYDKGKISVRFDRKSESFPAMLDITPELLRLIGYVISEGSLNKGRKSNRISLYSKNKTILEDMRHCIKAVAGKTPKEREIKGFGTATELSFNHKVLFELLKNHAGEGSSTRKIPDFIFGLSKEKIGEFLSGLYNGDGGFGSHAFSYYTISEELASDLAQLLLSYGIVASIIKRQRKDRKTQDHEIKFYTSDEKKEFLKYVKPLKKTGRISKGNKNPKKIGDLYIDKIKVIEKIVLDNPVKVYDLCVPGTQNFVGGFGGIVLHNSGHPSLSTIHAGGVEDLMKRLQTRPISLSAGLIESLDMVIIMIHAREKGKSSRRIKEIVEIESIDVATGTPLFTKSFVWLPAEDSFEYRSNSWLLSKVSTQKGLSMNNIVAEIAKRKKFLTWLNENSITDMKEIAKFMSVYHRSPEKISRLLAGEKLRDEY